MRTHSLTALAVATIGATIGLGSDLRIYRVPSATGAVFKRIYVIDVRDHDADGYVDKRLLVDLMNVKNPNLLGTGTSPFTFPYVTIEDVEILDDDTIAVLNDNNYPATGGRGPGVKDANEFLRIDLGTPLKVDHRLLPAALPPG